MMKSEQILSQRRYKIPDLLSVMRGKVSVDHRDKATETFLSPIAAECADIRYDLQVLK